MKVLRGPQGIVVGSRSIGGAISINTRRLKFDKVEGYGEATYGNYNTAALQGALNLPLSDTLAVRSTGPYPRHDSYHPAIGPLKGEPAKRDEGAARLSVLWRPDDFQLLFKRDFLVHDLGGFAYRPLVGTQYAAARTTDPDTVDYNSPSRQHERGWINGLEARYNSSGYGLRVFPVGSSATLTPRLNYAHLGQQFTGLFTRLRSTCRLRVVSCPRR